MNFWRSGPCRCLNESTGISVFLSVNSNEQQSTRFDFSSAHSILQLPPVWSNETLKLSIGEADVVTDMGTGGNGEDPRFALASFFIVRVQLP